MHLQLLLRGRGGPYRLRGCKKSRCALGHRWAAELLRDRCSNWHVFKSPRHDCAVKVIELATHVGGCSEP